MSNQFIIQIITLGLAITPVSLILINLINKIFSRYNPQIGKTTTICTTSLGTLIKDSIEIKTIVFDQYRAHIENTGIYMENLSSKEDLQIKQLDLQKNQYIRLMASIGTLCHHPKTEELEHIISKFFKKCAIGYQEIFQKYEKIEEIPSNDEKKISTTVARDRETKEIFAFSKGNPYKLLQRCTRKLSGDKKIEIDNQLRQKLKKRIDQRNKNGEKVIAFAYKPLPVKKLDNYTENFTENDLVWIGMIGLGNPVNMELIPTIEELKKLGIKIYMVACAKERQAVFTAKTLKIINPHYFETISKDYLKTLPDHKIEKMLSNKEKDYVFYDLDDKEKLRITKILQESGETVALISENNKHSFKEILENINYKKFKSSNYKKMVFHAISCKIIETFILLIALILKAPLPLTIPGILIIDICINSLLEFSLSKENPVETNKSSISSLIVISVFAVIIITIIYILNLMSFGWIPYENMFNNQAVLKSNTLIFVLIILIQIFNAYNLRSPGISIFKNITSNIHLILSTIVSVLTIAFLYFASFSEEISITKLNKTEWGIIFFALAIIIIFEEVRNILSKRNATTT